MEKESIKSFLKTQIADSENEYLELKRLVRDRDWSSQMAKGVIQDNIIRKINVLEFLLSATEGKATNIYESKGIEQGVKMALNLVMMESEGCKAEISNLERDIKNLPTGVEETKMLLSDKKKREQELECWDYLKNFLIENKF